MRALTDIPTAKEDFVDNDAYTYGKNVDQTYKWIRKEDRREELYLDAGVALHYPIT